MLLFVYVQLNLSLLEDSVMPPAIIPKTILFLSTKSRNCVQCVERDHDWLALRTEWDDMASAFDSAWHAETAQHRQPERRRWWQRWGRGSLFLQFCSLDTVPVKCHMVWTCLCHRTPNKLLNNSPLFLCITAISVSVLFDINTTPCLEYCVHMMAKEISLKWFYVNFSQAASPLIHIIVTVFCQTHQHPLHYKTWDK